MMNLAVIYYSSTGTNHTLAEALAQGARDTGDDVEVRVRRVGELAPRSAIEGNPAWKRYVDEVAPGVPEVTLDDLAWADGYAFGTPTRFGTPAAQLKKFLDTTGGLWQQGTFANKPVTTFTSAMNQHGGHEATVLSLNNIFYHWGSVIVPVGFTDPVVYASGGNPYGTSFATGMSGDVPDEATLATARHQGARLATIARKLKA